VSSRACSFCIPRPSFLTFFILSNISYIYSIPFFSNDFFFPFTLYSCSLTSIWSV
jgi:hypothetical protein